MKEKPLWLKWLFCVVPAIIAALMYFLLPYFPKFTEYVIARGVFRLIAFPFEWIVSLIPFSITELVVILAVPTALAMLIILVVKLIRNNNKKRTAERGLRFICWCISLVLLIFMVMNGANFYRMPVGSLMDLPDNTYTAQDLFLVTKDLAIKASKARESLEEDQNGCTVLSIEKSTLLLLADDCYEKLAKDYSFLKTATWRVKEVGFSHYWSYTGYTGVYCPWLAEASINTDVPDYDLGHTAVHEVAHTMGFAKENECNFLAWLACDNSDQSDYLYSGNLQAYIYCANALLRADEELWLKVREYCSDGMLRDMNQANIYWKSFDGEIEDSAQKLNDSFIKANGVENGVLSYNEMVELMLRYYDKNGLLN